jgi:DNA-binding MarR family transcriptional regulator
MTMSTENRRALHAAFAGHIRRFIAGTILFNQKLADRAGLHLTDMQCINLLDLLGPVTPGKLAECTGLTTGGVTVMLDRLEKAGMVKREPNPNDRRSVLVRVNPKKMKKIHAFYAGINEQLDIFLSNTPEEELQLVTDFLSRMNAIRAAPSSGIR